MDLHLNCKVGEMRSGRGNCENRVWECVEACQLHTIKATPVKYNEFEYSSSGINTTVNIQCSCVISFLSDKDGELV